MRHDALPGRIVLTSSRAVDGEGAWRTADGTVVYPAQRTRAALGVEPVVLRFQNVDGPGQSLANPCTGITSPLCRMAKPGRSIPLDEDGQVRRDFILIDEIARAVHAAATVADAPVGPVDIGSGEHQTIALAAELIAEHYGAPAPHAPGEFREGDVRHAWADVTRAPEVLGWRPLHALRAGITALATWIDAQEHIPAL